MTLKSTSVYMFKLTGGAISLRSVKQTITASSTIRPEFIACYEETTYGMAEEFGFQAEYYLIYFQTHKDLL